MYIAIDAREACKEKRTGKGQWAFGVITELLTRDHQVTLLVGDETVPSAWAEKVQVVTFSPGIIWHWNVKRWLEKSDADVYLSPTSFLVPALLKKTISSVIVVHDMIAFHEGPHDQKAVFLERLFLPKAIKKAKAVACISSQTEADLHDRFSHAKGKTSVIFAGPQEDTVSPNTSDGKTILCLGTLCPRKNQLRLIKAFADLPPELQAKHELVLIGGRGWHDDEIVKLVEQTKNVQYLGYVTNEQRQHWLSTAMMFALPSLYEGFGLPVLDAMKRGLPVLTSNRGSLKEVAGNAGLVVDPESVDSIRDGLEELLTSPELQSQLREKGPAHASQFSWKRTVDLLLATL